MNSKQLLCLILIFTTSLSSALTLNIPSYPEESIIPDDHTFNSGFNCSGDNVSPQLIWDEIPSGTQSFAVVFIDENFDFLHWKLYNIDPSVSHIPENNPNEVGTEGLTDFGIMGYGGPCPPSPTPGNYRMTVYALNTSFLSDPSVAMIQAAAIESASYLAYRDIDDVQERYEYAARYKMTFIAEWSPSSHPIDYPGGAHFSPQVGSTHTSQGFIWDVGGISTDGMEQMAESGGTSIILSEIESIINQGFAETSNLGIGALAQDSRDIFFDISDSHPLFSMVSMIAPSPDWFVGVHDVRLKSAGLWVDELTIELFPYDAGTQDGDSFNNPAGNTLPREPISLITTDPFPNAVRLGRFVFELQSTSGSPSDEVFTHGFE
ncbi:MAG: YbhB/YbcL family Raf kinase inhibitor-like protein [Marinicella sp.]